MSGFCVIRDLIGVLCASHLRRAKLLLRKKRFIEQQLELTDGQLENVERMIQDLEFAQVELKVSSERMCCIKINQYFQFANTLIYLFFIYNIFCIS